MTLATLVWIYVGRLICLVNFHEMALQSIWWRDISKDVHSSNPFRPNFSQKGRIWSRLSQSLQNIHWWRQWFPHLTRISSHRAKFLSLGTERNHTGPNPENRMDEESIHSPIHSFVIATVDLWDGALSWWKSTFLRANLSSNDYQTWTMRPFWLKFGLKGFEEWIFRDVIKWIISPFHENLPNLLNDPRIGSTNKFPPFFIKN